MKFFRRRQWRKPEDPFAPAAAKVIDLKPQAKYHLSWNEDVLVAKQADGLRLGSGFALGRIFNLKLFFAVFFLLLGVRLTWLQVARGAYYRELSDGNRLRLKKIEAKRGIIYDQNLNPLVHNVADWLLYFVPADLPADAAARQEIVSRLSNILGTVSSEEINDKLAAIDRHSFAAYQPLPIADNIDYQKAMLIYLEAAKTPGVVLTSQNRRQYLLPTLSYSQLLGYTGKINPEELDKFGDEYSTLDYLGKTGLEKFYESELRGLSGRQQVEVDALGKEKKIISQSRTRDGNNLVLSIDSLVQTKLEEIMRANLKKFGLAKGVAIVINPRNGEIISLVNLPTFNNNEFARGISREEYDYLANHPDQPLYLRAVAGEYPSGSTIKPVVLAGALAEGVVNEQTQFFSSGGLRINQWFFPDWKAGGHGWTDARQAIADSVNTYFYYVGGGYQDTIGLGIEKLDKYFALFGLGAQTGVDLPGEADGFLPTKDWKEATKKEKWYIGDTYHVAIGQGDLLVTPLQVAYYTSVFANGGTLYRPHLVKYILSSEDKLITATDITPVKSNVIDSHDIEVVRQGMRQAVTDGSAIRLNDLPVAAAGKTGTAQWSSKKPAHAWFTGFAPYDEPEVVVTVLLEEGEEGSRTAVSVAWEFLHWYFGQERKI